MKTPARFYRDYIRSHPAYKSDSVVSAEIAYDLAKEVDQMYVLSRLRRHFCSELTPGLSFFSISRSERGEKEALELLPEDYAMYR